MSIVLLSSLTVLLYGLAAAMQFLTRRRSVRTTKLLIMSSAGLAIIGHALLLHQSIDTQWGQNLSSVNLLSLASWLIVLFFVLLAFAKPIEQLGVILFPIAAISISLAVLMPGTHFVATANDTRQLLHILLAIITFSVLALAGLQAILLSLQDRRLRNNTMTGWMSRLPPLQTMETLLFEMITAGFILLTMLMLS
ncbi:MAG: cytochrome c biogenesis protein CcsA, partial [Pseudomonadota bacterium]|nr:cytochrome c biogenesis protein CcsA [Pseudomonadota bacterium]